MPMVYKDLPKMMARIFLIMMLQQPLNFKAYIETIAALIQTNANDQLRRHFLLFLWFSVNKDISVFTVSWIADFTLKKAGAHEICCIFMIKAFTVAFLMIWKSILKHVFEHLR